MTTTTIQGHIERITYTNEENGFTVAQLQPAGRSDLVTVVGNFAAVSPGEYLVMTGEWGHHPRFGRQFQASEYQTRRPATVEGIRKYLGSGLVKGIGPVMAERITRMFGADTLEVMDNNIEALSRVPGIGKKRVKMITAAWQEQQDIRQVMVFLQSHGVGTGYAVKIFRTYGRDAVAAVTADPYRLAADIQGIGFVTADAIAGKLGFPKDSPQRIRAGVVHVLNQLADEGHACYPEDDLLAQCVEILENARTRVAREITAMAGEETLQIDLLPLDRDGREAIRMVYLAGLHWCETMIARRTKKLARHPRAVRKIDTDKAVAWVQEKLAMTLADKQVEAVKTAATRKVMVIIGAPGTGKTTIVKAVLKIYAALGARVLLAAPTGRAARKLKEATGHNARTIHRLLEYSLVQGGFQRNSDRPLNCDLLVIDEASMIDTVLMYYLLQAVPLTATVVLVGDVNQLPAVGPGNILNDMIASGLVPVVTLNEIFRQAQQSRIVVAAHMINRGVVPDLSTTDEKSDFFFVRASDPDHAVDVITELVTRRIPGRFGLDPVDDIQVLTPMHKGAAGAANLNRRLQQALNPDGGGIGRGESTMAVADKVMQIRNNYDKGVFNGDIGRVSRIDSEARRMTVIFDERPVTYEAGDLDEIVLAYAISVHKSQGSEYPAVVIPVLTQHYVMLQRNLIYTAVTRGRRLVVLVGTPRAVAIGVKNNRTGRRYTGLRQRLQQDVPDEPHQVRQ